MPVRAILNKLPIDSYLLLLAGTVGLAWILPVKGDSAEATAGVVHGVVALLFFFYGARLAPKAVAAGVGHWRLQSMVFLSTYLLFPLIGLALYAAVQGRLAPEIAVGLLYLSLLPSTVQSSVAFTAIARGNTAAAVCGASFSSMVGVFITPALAALLLPMAKGGFSVHAVVEIGAQILLPFGLGQLMRPWLKGWLARRKGFLTVIDRGSILLVVYTAFSAGIASGVWTRVSPFDVGVILALDLAMLALMVATMIFASRALGFSREDEITIAFCGSNKSLAAGIPMATVLFAGHAMSLIVLPLMLFHQVQLFVCSLLSRRYARRSANAPDDAAEAAAQYA